MLARIPVANSIWIEVESDTELGLFKSMARASEVFNHKFCGKCKSADVRYANRRTVTGKKKIDWIEMQCHNFDKCGAKLVFSIQQDSDGVIYPKTRWDHLSETQQKERVAEKKYADEHNGFLPHGGWYIYEKKSV